jgi:hypothetical protein
MFGLGASRVSDRDSLLLFACRWSSEVLSVFKDYAKLNGKRYHNRECLAGRCGVPVDCGLSIGVVARRLIMRASARKSAPPHVICHQSISGLTDENSASFFESVATIMSNQVSFVLAVGLCLIAAAVLPVLFCCAQSDRPPARFSLLLLLLRVGSGFALRAACDLR